MTVPRIRTYREFHWEVLPVPCPTCEGRGMTEGKLREQPKANVRYWQRQRTKGQCSSCGNFVAIKQITQDGKVVASVRLSRCWFHAEQSRRACNRSERKTRVRPEKKILSHDQNGDRPAGQSIWDRVATVVVQRPKGGDQMSDVFRVGDWHIVKISRVRRKGTNGRGPVYRLAIPEELILGIKADKTDLVALKVQGESITLKKATLSA